ncbi:hypothetical protein BDR05DRAFT_1005715 [Suillus weaverae]|nr:hypothetical protein BDR05DRAFT_1005715 [Suillus weaverae]
MSDLQQVISLLSDLQTQMEVAQSDLQRDINSLHQDIAILGQDVARDVTSLRGDVKSLQRDVTSLQRDVTSLPQDLTLKQAMVYNLDQLSGQFVGLVGDFKNLAETIYSNFDSWAKVAHSRVIDKVLEIQRPRLKAIENKLHKNVCTCSLSLHNNSPTSAPVATAQPSFRPCLCVRVSDEAESEDGSSSEGTNSSLSIETASSGGNGTFGSHQ